MALTDNLVAYWTLDNTLSDESGNGYTLTNVNSTPYTASGKINGAYDFTPSSSNYMTRATGGPGNITGDYTISVWIRPDTININQEIVSATSGTSDNSRWGLRVMSDNTIRVFVDWPNTSYTNAFYTTSTVTAGTWVHVCMVIEIGVSTRMYINGSLDGSESNVGMGTSISPSGTFNIGAWVYSVYDTFFNGAIDEVGVWSSALTVSEIGELYNSGDGLAYPFSAGGGAANNALFFRKRL